MPASRSAMSRTCVTSGPLTRYCTGHPTGGPSPSGDTRVTALGNCVASTVLETRLKPLACRHVLGDDNSLGEEVVGQFHRKRQIEADRAAADIGAPACDVGIFRQHVVEPRGEVVGREDRGVLRQPEIDQKLRTIRWREELPRYQRRCEDGHRQAGDGDADGEPPRPHRADQKAPEARRGSGWAWSASTWSGLASITTPSSGANSTATNQDMISAMPTTAKIEKVYSPAELLAKPIGTKPAAVTNDPVSIGIASVR